MGPSALCVDGNYKSGAFSVQTPFCARKQVQHLNEATLHQPCLRRIILDKTPAYSLLTPAEVRVIKQFLPDVKIVIIRRPPLERMVSHCGKNWRERHKGKAQPPSFASRC